MKNLCCLVLLILSVSACQEANSQKDITNPNNISKIDTISYKLERISKEFGDCVNEGLKCAKTDLQYVILAENQTNAVSINLTIEKVLKGNAPTIEAMLDSFIAEGKAFFEEVPEAPGGYAWELEQSVISNTPHLLTIEEDHYAYTGGAHGVYGTGFYNFDIKKGKQVNLKDILVTGYEPALKDIAEPIFRKTYLEKGMTSYSEAGFYFENDQFRLNDNFAITKEGLKFVYNPYEIAPYVMGQQEILIPYQLLEDLFKKDGLLNAL